MRINPKIITVQIAVVLLIVFIIFISQPQKEDQEIATSEVEQVQEEMIVEETVELVEEEIIDEDEVPVVDEMEVKEPAVDEVIIADETVALKEPRIEKDKEKEVATDESLYVIINGEKYPKSIEQIKHTWDPKKESYDEWYFRVTGGGREVKQDRSELLRIYSEEDLKRMDQPRQWKPLPNIIGMSESDALKTMHKEGFTLRIAYEDGGIKEGTVIRTEFRAGRMSNTDAAQTAYVQRANKKTTSPPAVVMQPKPEKPVETPVEKPVIPPTTTQPPEEEPVEAPEPDNEETIVEPVEPEPQGEDQTGTTP